MAYKLFLLPIQASESAEAELNAFLRTHNVLAVEKSWVDQGTTSFWSFCVEYLDPSSAVGANPRQGSQRSRVDYRDVLNSEQFATFSQLRDLRKEIAQAEGIPVYTVFNNEQLARIVQMKAHTKADLEAIVGVGDARIAKYGDRFVEFLAQHGSADETDGQSV